MNRYKPIKRGLDIVFGVVGLSATAPLLIACAIAIKTDTPGPTIFKQARLGLNGIPFTMYKFRSMTVGAEAGGVYETAGDVRVTKVGRVLRRTSLDELPQLVNIIRGEMSFVGPRPTLTYHPWPLDEYSEQQRVRFDVRPGVTGLSQISGRKQLPWTERLILDAEYTNRVSFGLDAMIVLRTFRQILSAAENVNVEATVSVPNTMDQTKAKGV